MFMSEELLGFDVRLKAEDYLDRLWLHERRCSLLLNPQIQWPLSVDFRVWPSIFKYLSRQVCSIPINLEGLIYTETMNIRHDALTLWPNMTEMDKCLIAKGSNKLNGIKVAITLHADEEALSAEYWNAVLCPALSIDDLPHDWNLIGYDIADQDMISGLSNCSYCADEIMSLQAAWKSRINEHGLFDSFDEAMCFKDLTEKRVSSHAPFYIYSLFREPRAAA
jgi:hypothetical protein